MRSAETLSMRVGACRLKGTPRRQTGMRQLFSRGGLSTVVAALRYLTGDPLVIEFEMQHALFAPEL
jgi:hypothetical protein